jgi:hypothetical protein
MFAQFIDMLAAKNDEIESEVYDELLAIGLTEQKEFEEYNNRHKKTIKRRKFKHEVSTYVLSSGAICSSLISQIIVIIY